MRPRHKIFYKDEKGTVKEVEILIWNVYSTVSADKKNPLLIFERGLILTKQKSINSVYAIAGSNCKHDNSLLIKFNSSPDNFTSIACAFSMACFTFLAPINAMVIPGCSIVQRVTSWASVAFFFSARGFNFSRKRFTILIPYKTYFPYGYHLH